MSEDDVTMLADRIQRVEIRLAELSGQLALARWLVPVVVALIGLTLTGVIGLTR